MNIQLENMYKIKRINRRSHPTTKAVGFPAFVVKQSNVIPEEENRWTSLNNITHEELTPFARHAVANLPTNKAWRPNNTIRGKVIGLAKHENRLLVCEVLNDDGVLKGWCPIGGGIEFGETAQEALKREIQEELRCDVSITNDPITEVPFFKKAIELKYLVINEIGFFM